MTSARAFECIRRRIHGCVAVGTAVAAMSCAAIESEPRTHAVERSGDADVPVARPTTPVRGRVIGGEKAARVIAWPESARIDLAARERYAADVRDTLDGSPVPVLAPGDPGDRVSATVGPTWYALSVYGDGYLLHTRGSGEARVHPHVKTADPTHPMRVAGGFLTRNEDIWVASWIEHGAAYSFEVECDRRVVAWCDDEAEILGRVESLSYLGTKAGAR